MGGAGALRLDSVPAFDGLAVAVTTNETMRSEPAAGFTRKVIDGEGHVDEEFIARVCAAVNFSYGRLATCRQVHGTRICKAEVAVRQAFPACDGIATVLPDAPLAVFTADCVPVILWAPRRRALALLHAGWRGTLAKIVRTAVEYLNFHWGVPAAEVIIFLGPAIGPCCYEVGGEVVGAAESAFGKKARQLILNKDGSYFLDLHRANELVAQEAGVRADNIYRLAECAFCNTLFPSWRRDGPDAGRTVTLAAITAAPRRNVYG